MTKIRIFEFDHIIPAWESSDNQTHLFLSLILWNVLYAIKPGMTCLNVLKGKIRMTTIKIHLKLVFTAKRQDTFLRTVESSGRSKVK